jgi:transcriptional regulator with XRE-family HTH domain
MIGARLKEERLRLGFSQEQFAEKAGVTRSPYTSWEAGKTSPTVVQLSALADIGVDTHYVLTGTRYVGDLTPVEAALLDNYRNSPEAGKDAIRRTAFAFSQPDVKGEAA